MERQSLVICQQCNQPAYWPIAATPYLVDLLSLPTLNSTPNTYQHQAVGTVQGCTEVDQWRHEVKVLEVSGSMGATGKSA
jgi:hypothetical protein